MRFSFNNIILSAFVVLFIPLHGPYAGEFKNGDNSDFIISFDNLEWQFYWQHLLSPEDFSKDGIKPDRVLNGLKTWNRLTIDNKKAGSFGHATYRTTVELPPGAGKIGVYLPSPFNSLKLFFNNEKVAQIGRPGTNAQSTEEYKRSAISFYRPDSNKIDITLQVANYTHYRGGPRPGGYIGNAENVRLNYVAAMALDLFSMGVIFAIMVYHFFLFISGKRSKTVLLFGLLSLVYFLLSLFFGEQTIALIFNKLPLWLHVRFGSGFTYAVPPLVLLFTYHLYPQFLKKRWGYLIGILSAVYLSMLFLPIVIFSRFNLIFYVGVAAPAFIISLLISFKAFRKKRAGAMFHFSGILVFSLLIFYAIYLNTTSRLAGSFVSIGFAVFAFLQSAALAKEHSRLENTNEKIQYSLEKARKALKEQRDRLEANLHDNIGGSLTDMKLFAETTIEKHKNEKIIKPFQKILNRINTTLASFRSQLLFLEDFEMVTDDFFQGLNLILLRRYTAAARALNFRVDNAAAAALDRESIKNTFTDDLKLEYTLLVQEVCTNNLKYGDGEAGWRFSFSEPYLTCIVESLNGHKVSENENSSGRGSRTITERLEKLSGSYDEEKTENKFRLIFSIRVI